jgi:sporulation protein YlmC with PRC-barrel domain
MFSEGKSMGSISDFSCVESKGRVTGQLVKQGRRLNLADSFRKYE